MSLSYKVKREVVETVNLSEKFVEVVAEIAASGKDMIGWDEFFDMYNVPAEYRSGFAVASIMKGAMPILKEKGLI